MTTLDIAGNYLFSELGYQFRVQKMDIFVQREMMGLLQAAMRQEYNPVTGMSEDHLELFTKEANALQDWLMPRIYYKVDDDKWLGLNRDNLVKFLESNKEIPPINLMNSIFMTILMGLMQAFTGTGLPASLSNSGQQPENSQDQASTPSPLSRILSQ